LGLDSSDDCFSRRLICSSSRTSTLIHWIFMEQEVLSKKVGKKVVQAFYDQTTFFLKAYGFGYNNIEGRKLPELLCYGHISGLVCSAVNDGRQRTRRIP
jgi:hypothetical protein